MDGEVASLWKVLPQQAVRIFVAAAYGEIHRYLHCNRVDRRVVASVPVDIRPESTAALWLRRSTDKSRDADSEQLHGLASGPRKHGSESYRVAVDASSSSFGSSSKPKSPARLSRDSL